MKRTNKFRLVLAALALALLAPVSPARARGERDKEHGERDDEHGKRNNEHGERDNEEREERDRQRPVVPAILEPTSDQKVTFHAFAVGVQIYGCTQNATDPSLYSWVFKAPE